MQNRPKKIILILLALYSITGCSGTSENATEQYTVTYHSNINDITNVPIDDNSYNSGDIVTIKDGSSMVNSGFLFKSWNTDSIGNGQEFLSGSTITIGNGNVDLYAIWETDEPIETSIFCYRRDYSDVSNYLKQIVQIDIDNGDQTVIANLSLSSTYLDDIVYLETTDQLLGLSENQLVKISLSDGTSSTIDLYSGTSRSYNGLILDFDNNVYCYRRDYSDVSNYLKQIVQIDIDNGDQTVIANLSLSSTYLDDLIYLESSNQLLGLSESQLIKISLSDGTSSAIDLYSGTSRSYNGLILDSDNNVYCYRRDYSDVSNYLKQIVQIDIDNGDQTVIANLSLSSTYLDNIVYLETTDQLLGLSENQLVKISLSDGTSSVIDMYSGTSRSYKSLVKKN